MSDSRQVYRAIRQALRQLYASEPKGNLARHLNRLAGMITGIVLRRSCHLPKMAHKAPDETLAESRHKRFSHWVQNEAISAQFCFLPFVQALLTSLAALRPLVLVMDGSEVARDGLALVISVLYGRRALPVAWVVVAGSKGHFPADTHLRLVRQVTELLPQDAPVMFLGDGDAYADSVELQQALDACGWAYVCRTVKNTQVEVDGAWRRLDEIDVQRGRRKMWRQVRFTASAYGPVQVIGWWGSGHDEPLYLVTNLADPDDACRRYEKRGHIEALFSDKESRGFQLDRSHLDDLERVTRLLIATCLAYLWLIYMGTLASPPHWRRLIHRSDRCDLSLFQLGLRLLEFWLDDDAPLRIAFCPKRLRPKPSSSIVSGSECRN